MQRVILMLALKCGICINAMLFIDLVFALQIE